MDRDAARWTQLALVSLALLAAMSAWFGLTAVGDLWTRRWQLGPGQAAWLTTIVQVGFVAGTAGAALLNLADIWPSRSYFAASALLAAVSNALLLAAPDYPTALALRFVTGVSFAGVYPPAMKMIATWFRSARGFAIGAVVGALTIGKAMPYLLNGLGGATTGATVIAATSVAAALAGGAVFAGYRDGPHPFARRPFEWQRVGRILRHRPTMLATAGYLGHMWELYAGWLLITPFFAAVFTARGGADPAASGSLWGFVVIAVGGLGAVVAGLGADRWGRTRVASGAMLISGLGSVILGWLLHAPLWVVGTVAIIWGATIVADSAQFSALVTEVAPSDAVGTALTLQTMLGFALTGVSMQLGVRAAESLGWGPAFTLLAVGPALGIAAMRRLSSLPPHDA